MVLVAVLPILVASEISQGAAAAEISTSSQGSIIAGYFLDLSGAPILHVRVRLIPKSKDLLRRGPELAVLTNDDGFYSFDQDLRGSYRIVAEHANYVSFERDVFISCDAPVFLTSVLCRVVVLGIERLDRPGVCDRDSQTKTELYPEFTDNIPVGD